MHIHGSMLNIQGANFASIASGEQSAAAQRAANVRKRLLTKAQTLGAGTSPDETLLIGQWLDAGHGQMLSGDEYHAGASGKESDLG